MIKITIVFVAFVKCIYSTTFTLRGFAGSIGDPFSDNGAGSIHSVDLSADETKVVVGTTQPAINIFDFVGQTLICAYSASSNVEVVRFSHDGTYVAASYLTDDLIFISASDCSLIQTLATGHGGILDLDFNSDSTKLVTCGSDNSFKTWNVPALTADLSILRPPNVRQCRYTYDDWIYLGEDNGILQLYNSGGSLDSTYNAADGGHVVSIATHPTRHEVVLSTSTDKVYKSSGAPVLASGLNMRVGYSRRYFALAEDGPYLVIFDAETNSLVQNYSHASQKIRYIDFNSEGNVLIAGSEDSILYILETASIPEANTTNTTNTTNLTNQTNVTANQTSSLCVTGYYSDNGVCVGCAQALTGCGSCVSSSLCTYCLPGYYIQGGTCTLCSSSLTGCIVCDSSTSCLSCVFGYYLTNSACVGCRTGCASCLSESNCQMCINGYTMVGSECVQVEVNNPSIQILDISLHLRTQYLNETHLKQILRVKGTTYTFQQIEWSTNVQFRLKYPNSTSQNLSLEGMDWGQNQLSFFTNNPITFTTINEMPISRLLLASSIQTVGYGVEVDLSQSFFTTLLPGYPSPSISLNFALNDPSFLSTVSSAINPFQYHVFGIIVTIGLFLIYLAKAIFIRPDSFDKGQIIPHILAYKTAVLIVYPTYLQLYDFCYGFMMADFPFTNRVMGEALGDKYDIQPDSYSALYVNMNIGSTYTLALCVIVALLLVGWIVCRLFESDRFSAYLQFMYVFFIFGVVFAGCGCMQGAFMNELTTMSANSFFYLIGIGLYFGFLIECIYSLMDNATLNMFKLRIFIKASLLAFGHFSPISIVFLAFCVDVGLIVMEYNSSKAQLFIPLQLKHPKVWAINQVLLDVGLLLLLYVPHIVLSLIGCMIIIVACVIVDVYLNYKQIASKKEQTQGQKGKKQQLEVQHIEHNVSNDFVFVTEDDMVQRDHPQEGQSKEVRNLQATVKGRKRRRKKEQIDF